MELLFREVDLTNHKKIAEKICKSPIEIQAAIEAFEKVKQNNIEDKTFKEWTSQCFEVANPNHTIRILVYIMFFN